jgi:hypothetical protein
MANNTIQDIQTSKRFGRIKKVVWFSITNTNGSFNINLYIKPSQNENTSIIVFNQSNKQEKYNKTYLKSATTNLLTDSVKINYNSQFDSTIFGIKSI